MPGQRLSLIDTLGSAGGPARGARIVVDRAVCEVLGPLALGAQWCSPLRNRRVRAR